MGANWFFGVTDSTKRYGRFSKGSNPLGTTQWRVVRVVRWNSAKVPTQVRILYSPHMVFEALRWCAGLWSRIRRFDTVLTPQRRIARVDDGAGLLNRCTMEIVPLVRIQHSPQNDLDIWNTFCIFVLYKRSVRLRVRSHPFHGCNTGSNPVLSTTIVL